MSMSIENTNKVDVIDFNAKVVDKVHLNPHIFDCDYKMDSVKERFSVVHQVLRWQMNKSREAIQDVKNRSGVRGAHRKIRSQKESGRARQGDGKACHFRGGGRAFKINSRNYEFKINKKFHNLAKRIVLTHKFANNGIVVMEDLSKCDMSKTKSVVDFLTRIERKEVLFITTRDVYKSKSLDGVNNLYKVDMLSVEGLNVKSMLDRTLVFDVKSLSEAEKMLVIKSGANNE